MIQGAERRRASSLEGGNRRERRWAAVKIYMVLIDEAAILLLRGRIGRRSRR